MNNVGVVYIVSCGGWAVSISAQYFSVNMSLSTSDLSSSLLCKIFKTAKLMCVMYTPTKIQAHGKRKRLSGTAVSLCVLKDMHAWSWQKRPT